MKTRSYIVRYSKSNANTSAALLSADRGYVYDNSITDRNPRILFRARDGEVFSKLEVIFCAVSMAENNFVNALILFIKAKEYSDLKHHQRMQLMGGEVRFPGVKHER